MVPDYAKIRTALESPATSGTFLNAFIRETYGDEAYEWDPLTIVLELKDDFSVELSSEGVQKWSAMQVAMTSDAFFKRVDAFLPICNTLSNGDPYFTAFNPVSVESAAWGVVEVSLNRDIIPASYAVKQYVRTILDQDAYTKETYPEALNLILHDDTKPSDVISTELSHNAAVVDNYIVEGIESIIAEFARIPGMERLDKYIYDYRELDI